MSDRSMVAYLLAATKGGGGGGGGMVMAGHPRHPREVLVEQCTLPYVCHG
jgi:hypothetical protein